MKKIILCSSFICMGFLGQAQRFFYIEGSHHTDRVLQEKLMKSAQFVAPSPLASDYIINTDFEFLTGADVISMKLNVKDSVSRETIFQAKEEYAFGVMNKNSPMVIRMAIEHFLERNISQIITSANTEHYDAHAKYLKPRKDKT